MAMYNADCMNYLVLNMGLYVNRFGVIYKKHEDGTALIYCDDGSWEPAKHSNDELDSGRFKMIETVSDFLEVCGKIEG